MSRKGTLTELPCGKRSVLVYCPSAEFCKAPLPTAWICAGDELRTTLEQILLQLEPQFGRTCAPFCICSVVPAEWGRDYTPWPVPSLWKSGEPFTGGAKDFFELLTCQAMPLVQKRLPVSEQAEQTALLGYSLGGLAALWQTAQDWHFGMCGSISGSLWYDNFPAWFAERIDGFREKKVYLSLGRSEEKTRDPRMQQVGDCTRRAAELLHSCTKQSVLEWNSGGHFTGIPQRIAKALLWLFRSPQ